MILRAVNILTIVVALALAAMVARNQQRIGTLRESRQQLAGSLAAAGIAQETHHPSAESRSKRPRGRGHGDDDDAIAATLDYARGLGDLDALAAPDRLRRVAIETERIQHLGVRQLRALHDALQADTTVAADHRDALCGFVLTRLARSHPHDALNRLLGHPPGPRFGQTLGDILMLWAIDAPDQARDALAGHLDRIPRAAQPDAQSALLAGMLLSDPTTARQLGEQAGITPGSLAEHARSDQLSLEQQDAAQAVLKTWADDDDIRQAPPHNSEDLHPVAKRIPGKPGYVLSPNTYLVIDVRDIPSGSLVSDPTSPDAPAFRVP